MHGINYERGRQEQRQHREGRVVGAGVGGGLRLKEQPPLRFEPRHARSGRKGISCAASLHDASPSLNPRQRCSTSQDEGVSCKQRRTQNSLYRRNLSSLCSLGGETPLLRPPGQDYLYSAAGHLLVLQENVELLLGCMKQSLIFITCLFILVEKDTVNSNPRHPQNAHPTLGWVRFLTRRSGASWPSAQAPSYPDSPLPAPPEVQRESVAEQGRPQLSRESKLTFQTIFQLFQINFKSFCIGY